GGGPRRCSPTASCAAGQGASGGARAVRPSRAAARPPQDDGIWDGGDDMSVSRRQVMTGSLALALAGRAAAQEADWPRVIEAARKEGKVVIYNAAIGAGYYTEVAKAFERTYGIRVE